MKKIVADILLLAKCAISNEIPDVALCDVDWNNVFALASKHRITTLVYYGIKETGADIPADIKKQFETKLYKSTMLAAENEYLISQVCGKFGESGIDFMPMKGLVVRSFYPRPEMRTVGDADILIREDQLESAANILSDLGFSFEKESSHEHVWHKKNTTIELHKKIIGTTFPEYYDYYADTSRFFEQNGTNDRYQHKMSTDDLFIYLIVHIAKHYRNGGIGLRHFIDLYAIERSGAKLDNEYIVSELSHMKLEKFYENVKNLLGVWFNGKNETEVTSAMTAHIFKSGLFGRSSDHARANAAATSFPLLKKIIYVVFLPYKHMKKLYPALEKAPVLLPIFWLVRIFKILLYKKDKIIKKTNHLKYSSRSESQKFMDELKLVGFDQQ